MKLDKHYESIDQEKTDFVRAAISTECKSCGAKDALTVVVQGVAYTGSIVLRCVNCSDDVTIYAEGD